VAIRYYCGHCGHETRPDARVCPNCGGLLYQAARAPTPDANVPTPQPYPGTQPEERVRGLWLRFLARYLAMRIALVLVILVLAAFLSPILSVVAILALFASLAGAVVLAVPAVVLFVIFQRYFVESETSASLAE
jgi:hypothetical protein